MIMVVSCLWLAFGLVWFCFVLVFWYVRPGGFWVVVYAFVLAFPFVSSWILHGVVCIIRVEAGWLDVSLAWKLFASLRLFFSSWLFSLCFFRVCF